MSLCLCLPLSAVVYQQPLAHSTINNDSLMRISPDQADRMFLVFKASVPLHTSFGLRLI